MYFYRFVVLILVVNSQCGVETNGFICESYSLICDLFLFFYRAFYVHSEEQ